MKSKVKKEPLVKCPWCGTERVQVTGGRLRTHTNPNGEKCHAIGWIVADKI